MTENQNEWDEFQPASAAAQPAASEWDEFTPVAAAARTVLRAAGQVNPDQAAKADVLARKYKASPDPLLRTLQSAEMADAVNRGEEVLRTSPKLARVLTDKPWLAAQTHDDLEPLAKLESGAVARSAAAVAQATLGVSESIWRTPDTAQRLAGYLAGQVERTGLPWQLNPVRGVEFTIAALSEGRLPGMKQGVGGTTNIANKIAGAQEVLTDRETFGDAFADLGVMSQNADKALLSMLEKGDTRQIREVISSPDYWAVFIAQAAPSLYIAAKSGGSLAFMGWLEGMEQSSNAADFEKRTGQKISDAEFSRAVLQTALINAVLEKSGLDKVVGARGKGVTGVLKAIFAEGGTEGLQQFNSNLAAALSYDPNKSLSEGVVSSVMGGAGAGGGGAAVSNTAYGVQVAVARRQAKIEDAKAHAEQLQALMQAAAATKSRERNPQSFRELVDQITSADDGQPATIFVDAQVLAQAVPLQELQELLPSAAAQLEEAVAANSSVEIPLSEALTVAPGTPLEQLLLQNARRTPEALSMADAQTAQEQQGQMLRDDATRVISEAVDQEAALASADKVKQIFADQFARANSQLPAATATKFTPDVVEVYTDLMRSFYTVLGGTLGTTAEEAYTQYPYNVVAGAQQLQKGNTLSSSATPGAALEARIARDYPAAVAEYSKVADTDGGRVLNVDLARELSPEYRADRTRSGEVHEPSSAFIKRVYADRLSKPTPAGKAPYVLFTAGGTGAGKSTGLSLMGKAAAEAEIIYDTNMNGFESSDTKIQQALAAGREVRILYVYRDPVEAMTAGALPRAMRMGRTVPVVEHGRTHVGARQTLQRLAEKYAGDPRVQITVVDNSRGKGQAVESTLADLPEISDNGLEGKLREAAKAEFEAGRVSEAVYRGTVGAESPDGTGAGQGVRGQSEQENQSEVAKEQRKLRQAVDLALVGKPTPRQATQADFAPDTIGNLLNLEGWAVLTAEDPAAQKATPEQNAEAQARLEADLRAMGAEFTPAVGKYGDVQNAFIVTGVTEEEAVALGNKYGQESILTRRGLVYGDGRLAPATGIQTFQTPPEDFYTEIPGTGAFFSVNLDFDADKTFKQSMSTRVPTGVKRIENPLAEQLTVGLDVVKRNPALLEKFATKTDGVPSLRTSRFKDPGKRLEAYIDQMADNLLWLHDQMPAGMRNRAKLWYDGARAVVDRWTAKYDGTYTDMQLAGVLAVMSPQMDWFQNVTLAERIVDIWHNQQDLAWTPEMTEAAEKTAMAGRTEDLALLQGSTLAGAGESDLQALWIAAYDLAYNPREFHIVTPEGDFGDVVRNLNGSPMRGSWANGFGPIAKAVSVLRDGSVENVSAQLGEKHKVRNFYNNIFAPTAADGAVTIDTHAVAAALLSPLSGTSPEVMDNFGAAGSDKNAGIYGTYPVYAEAYRRAAEKRGLLPREMQSITWEAVRGLFNPSFKSNYKRDGAAFDTIWKDYHAKRIDLATARQRVLDAAGGITNPDWYGPDRAGAEPRWSASYAGELLAEGGMAGAAGPGTGGNAAAGTAGLGDRLAQGPAQPGAVDVTGVHFSRETRRALQGAFYGTGLKGLEGDRVTKSGDPRLKSRVYFYVDEGKGVRPEAGVGGAAHEAALKNLYDAKADPLRLWRGDINDIESRILDSGFDGYYVRDAFNQQGAAVVLGKAASYIEVTSIDNPTTAAPALPEPPRPYKRGLLSRELSKLDLPALQAVAPSLKIDSGNLTVDRAEFAAAQAAAREMGVDLPGDGALNQSMAEDSAAQAEFLTQQAKAAGYASVDEWAANDITGFLKAAAQWRAQNPAESLAQENRGTFNPATLTTTLLETSDLTTFLHETGHFFLEVMADVATRADAPATARQDMDAILRWFGVDDLAKWRGMTLDQQRPYHEKFAESFEQYLFEGKAPNPALRNAFRRFRQFMLSVYKSLEQFLTGRDTKMSDEVRGVFDRLLATEAEIKEAEAQAGMLPDFDATNAAIERLSARSLREMRWAVNARNKILKQLQHDVAGKRKLVEAEVRAEVETWPEYAAQIFLRENKLAISGLEEMYSGEGDRYALLDWKPLVDKKMAGREGTHPDVAADALGFSDGDTMVRAVLSAEPIASVIEGMTDQRMLERYSDIATPEARERAATEAVHNDVRAKMLAAELKAQSDALNPREQVGTAVNGRAVTVNALVEAAKNFAKDIVARRSVKELKRSAQQHRAAEARAGKEWQAATSSGDTQAALAAKRDQMLNNFIVRELVAAQAEAKKVEEFFRRVTKDSNEKTVEKGRDPDVVNAMRAVLAAYGVAPRLQKSALGYMESVAEHDPAMYQALKPSVDGALFRAKPLPLLTIEELRALNEEMRAMWDLARRSRQMEVDGDLLDIDDAAALLLDRMETVGIPTEVPGERKAIGTAEEAGIKLQFAKAILSRVEQWSERMDGKFGGPFLRLIFQPIKVAADHYRTDKLVYRKKYVALLQKIEPSLRPGPIEAPELGYTFGAARDSGVAELLHAILHTGNGSNKRKLLLGRGWASENADGTMDTSRWDTFIDRMQTEGRLTKAHYDFAQGVWDLLETARPMAQETHRKVFGRYFNEVTAEAFTTPFGTYKGGYVPAQTDGRQVNDAALRELAEGENEGMAYAFPSAPTGFTKSRVEYNRPLLLDLRALSQHLDKVLLFSHMQPAVNDVRRLLTRRSVSGALTRLQPGAYEGMLLPWLNRSARQVVETPVAGDRKLSRFLAAARSRAGMALMFANVSNTVQQITGFSLAAVKVRPGLLMSTAGRFISAPLEMRRAVAEASEFMRTRMSDEIGSMNDAVESVLVNPGVYDRAQAWTLHHAYFMQAAVDNVTSTIVWTAGYNQAVEQGFSHPDAVRFADGVVRQSQGTTLPEDVSRFETGPASARLFTQFIGYFNMMANTNATALAQISQEMGLRKGAGRALYVALVGLLVPIWVAEAIAVGFRGGPGDDDDDGYLDDWLAAVFGLGTFRGLLAQVPLVGQAAQLVVNRFNDRPADDKFSLSPAVSILESAVGSPASVYKAIAGEGSAQKALRDTAAAATMLTGLPFYAAARPAGYAVSVADGRVDPTGPVDAARGLVTGTASPESRGR